MTLKTIFILSPFVLFLIPNSVEYWISFDLYNNRVNLIEIFFFFSFLLIYLRDGIILNRKKYVFYGILLVFLIFQLGRLLIDINNRPFDGIIEYTIGLFEFTLPLLLINLVELNEKEYKFLEKSISIIALLLSIEVIIYSLGILTYSGIVGEKYVTTILLSRISTTIGAATGTSYMILFFFIIINQFDQVKYLNLIKSLLIVAILLTLTRGAIIALLIILCVNFIHYLKRYRFIKRNLILLTPIIIIVILFSYGFFQPFEDRFFSRSKESTSKRFLKFEKSWSEFKQKDNFFIGDGFGRYYPRFHRTENPSLGQIRIDYSPHNTFLVLLNELGIIGFSLTVILLLFMFFRYYSNYNFIPVFEFSTVLLFLMTFEVIILSFRYSYPVFLSFLLITQYERKNG